MNLLSLHPMIAHDARVTRSLMVSSFAPGLISRMIRWLILTTASLIAASPAAADDPLIVRIEEDWRVEVGEPQPDDHAPQIVTVISPVSNLEREHSVFELNHATFPEYTPGGMQLQCWRRDWLSGYGTTPQWQRLNHHDEVITYTSVMKLEGGMLEFQIDNGKSKTWSTFGGNGYLKTRCLCLLASLNDYSPEVSVANSRVAFASHRVRKLVLTEVRYFGLEGLVATDRTSRVVHEHTPE